jgi:hypothetical protein
MEKVLSEPSIGSEERELILKEMKKKCSVLYKGFLRRGNEMEGSRYQEIMRRYGIEI